MKTPVKTRAAQASARKVTPNTAGGKKAGTKSAAPKAAARKTKSAKPAKKAAASPKVNTMNDTIESMTAASNEALKEGFEKTLKSVTEATNFQKETVDALIESSTIAGKGIETINSNAAAYAKSVMEEGVTTSKKLATAKSVQDLFEIQSDYTKTAMDTYLAELNKSSDLISELFKESLKPLNARVSAAVDLAQAQR